MIKESESMKEIRKIRDQIYEETKNMSRDERIKYLKEEVIKAKKIFKSQAVHN